MNKLLYVGGTVVDGMGQPIGGDAGEVGQAGQRRFQGIWRILRRIGKERGSAGIVSSVNGEA